MKFSEIQFLSIHFQSYIHYQHTFHYWPMSLILLYIYYFLQKPSLICVSFILNFLIFCQYSFFFYWNICQYWYFCQYQYFHLCLFVISRILKITLEKILHNFCEWVSIWRGNCNYWSDCLSVLIMVEEVIKSLPILNKALLGKRLWKLPIKHDC